MRLPKFLLPQATQVLCQVECSKGNMNCGDQVAENGRKNKFCGNQKNRGNGIAKIEGKKIVAMELLK